jgi:putative oxidoreductase
VSLQSAIVIVGRLFLALLFILAGVNKIIGPQPVLAQMTKFGVPEILLPAVIALEIVAGAILLSGWKLPYAATALAFFCLLTAVIFHREFGIPAERTQFFKDLALAGALMVIAATSWRRPDEAGRV